MHLALNAYFWDQPHTGSGQYTRQLVYHLNRFVSDLEITLIMPYRPDEQQLETLAADIPPSVRVEPVTLRAGHIGKVRFEQIDFPRACAAVKADIAHVPYWGGPLRSPVPIVVTIHDLITMIVPEYRRSAASRAYTALVAASARGANHILTDSVASQSDIVQRLGIPAEKVSPIYLGIGAEYTAEDDFLLDMAIKQKYDLPDFYVLYLGGYTLHKNVTTLLKAYTFAAQGLGPDYPLLLVGKKPDKVSAQFPDYDELINTLGLEQHVRWIGYVDEADKPAIYREAMSFVFPSRYEGFGLPPLEAMACDTPVVTTTAPGISEVVGDAAVAVDPDDARQMGGAIIATVIQDNFAAELRQKGRERVQQFTWQKTATETVRVYADVLEKRS